MTGPLISMYRPRYLTTLVYMYQSTEYQSKEYLAWCWRAQNFDAIMYRRTLDRTKVARLLLKAIRFGVSFQLLLGASLIYLGIHDGVIVGGWAFGVALIISYPFVWAYMLVVPVELGRIFITLPRDLRLIEASKVIFAKHPGVKIAVAGSYGKTTMKELLTTVLKEGKKVAATPGNKNVSSSHAAFSKRLTGKEDVLIIEYGEGAPGDVTRFAEITRPTHAVITGLAPAHLDQYKTLQAAGEDIFSVTHVVPAGHAYVNVDSSETKPFMTPGLEAFSNDGALGWKVQTVKIGLDRTTLTLKKGSKYLKLESWLIGRHQIGFLAFVAALALELGLTEKQVKAGIAKTKPFEHRMQPYILNGAWIVDDTYNGNLEGIRAGTELLKEVSAKRRKIYVTPGLVGQGDEVERVHIEVGRLIADAKPDEVVLMQNSTTDYIRRGLEECKYAGELRIETDPLAFYTNLTHYVASGDVVLMQNDWTDNYA